MLNSPIDWLILVVVILVILGGSKKIPEIAKALGRAMGEFKKGKMEIEQEMKKAIEEKENTDTKN